MLPACVDTSVSSREGGAGAMKRSPSADKMSRLRKARAFFHDLPNRSFSTSTSLQRVSYVTKENIERSFMVLREGIQLDRDDLQYIQTLLIRCQRCDNMLDVLDEGGWNLLQRSIICNQPQVVAMLIAKGVDLNAGVCSLPLHLACKLGHAPIVHLLLDNGAKADLSRSVCYPIAHTIKPSTGGKPPKLSCRVVARIPAPPLNYAIPSDRDEVLKVLLTHTNSKDVVKKDFLLHESCKFRAKRCLKLLVDMLPEQVNVKDKKGFTPLQHALNGPRNRDCAVILLESQAQFAPEIFETDFGTLLHEMYVSDDTSHILRLTQLMLEKGPSDLATKVTKGDGDTLLNKLLKYFGGSTPRDREQYVEEVKQCIILLISKDCDPNQVNKKGESALHSLLAHHGGRPLFYIRDRFGVAPSYLSSLLGNMSTLISVLLESGASANLMSPPNVVSPLYYLMRVVCAMSPHLLSATSEQVKGCVRVLCKNGADPNLINAFGDNTITLLLGSLSRWLYHACDDPNRLLSLLTFTEETLCLFLSHGLDPQMVLRKNLKQFVIIFNSTILDSTFLRHLNRILRHVIRGGGNLNLVNLNELHSGSCLNPPYSARKYTVSYYLARGLYIHARYQNLSAFDILDVFGSTLTQQHLTEAILGICANLDEEFEQGQRNVLIQARVKAISEHPRSLRQLSRVAIYHAIDWRIEKSCKRLPLPPSLISYIYTIE
ncbi:hypothetical protein CAPTEDRAFT_217743 [Capitella teleta]|uniref:SOCS box domain-containing protein n=1 Tax=Capitella teleta TaxID=283909 RepID=X2AML7_CAPTE|nr:hypothetical protein CAPTEDRAFT_217743 [Capitella teleta]|eukprot:ELU00353.1 hypothetical protein CAPTEDRAFT_217743 [Capitella teleta]